LGLGGKLKNTVGDTRGKVRGKVESMRQNSRAYMPHRGKRRGLGGGWGVVLKAIENKNLSVPRSNSKKEGAGLGPRAKQTIQENVALIGEGVKAPSI